ncbi:hypothetical protein INR49_015765, partial [Caranx melampygus]
MRFRAALNHEHLDGREAIEQPSFVAAFRKSDVYLFVQFSHTNCSAESKTNSAKWEQIKSDLDLDMDIKQAGMQTIVLLVLWVLGTSLVLPDPDTAGDKVTEEPIPCSKGCTCLHDDYSLELNMYCSVRNFTQVPSDIPTLTHSLWLDGNLFTTLPAVSFKDLTNLDFLNLQSGHLVTLDPQAFKGLRSLAHIHLERNSLRSLPGTIFQNTPNLASLSLHNNQLTRIEERLFAGLSHMWLLNLGWNSIAVLPETAFHDLHGLRELVLAGNRLAYLQPQLFQNLVELKELDLTGNYLKVIKANVFLKLIKLQKLYLAQNHIVTVVPRAFAGMKSLRWLDLTNNRLTSLHDDTFLGLHSLHVLRLSNNSITGIRPRTFRDLQYLEELRLSYNKIRALGERIFEGLCHLEVLELDHNQVQEAQMGSFTGLSHVAVINLSGSCFQSLPDQVFKGLPKLHSLHLDRGCLTRITTQAFTGLAGLRRLFLQHNNISVVERQSFVDLVGLSGLDLSFNQLEVLTTHTFTGLKNLEYLLLSNNECRQFLQNGTKQSETEEISVYERPAGFSLKVLEDSDSFSLEDAELEKLLKPSAQTCWPEETCCSLGLKLDDNHIAESASVAQGCRGGSDDDAELDSRWSNTVELNRAEQDTSVKPDADRMKPDADFPVLSFAMIDQWDLDSVLQNLKDNGVSLRQHVSVAPAKKDTDGDKHRSEDSIMERLVSYCTSQTSKSVSERGASPKLRQNNVWSKSLERMAEFPGYQECPTVYIDLRCSDPSIKPPRTSPNLSSVSKSPAKYHTVREAPPAKKLDFKVHTGSCMGESDQQRRQMKQTLLPEQRQQILKQLEKHRPTRSVYQKQPAAERTDVLYDCETSHLQPVSTLPGDIKTKGCILLTVKLSSPGMVEDRVPGKRNSAEIKAHIYNTLVAWFLSLVGPDTPDEDEAEGGVDVPFWVAGLQQLWTENGLVLNVLAVARHYYKLRKRDTDVHAPFYSHVCRFLCETSLTQIALWLPELQILLNQQAYTSHIHLPPSCLNCFITENPNKKVIDRTFGLTPGFYWQTVETQERVCKRRETTQELQPEVSVALGCSGFFLHPLITHYTLQLVMDSGLDVCGLRLLYPPHRFLSDSAGGVPVNHWADDTCQPVLALAVRGLYAHSLLKDILSSLDPLLPKNTDPTSVSRGQDPPLVYSPPLASQVYRELCLWFSGRFEGDSAQSHDQPQNGIPPSDDRGDSSLNSLSQSPAFLCTTTKADILLVVSPVVSPCCYGQVLAVCERRGFSLLGMQRLWLQRNRAASLRLSSQQINVFCSSHTVTLDQRMELPSKCLVLILRKENAMHHSVSLPAALMREFKGQKLLGRLLFRLNGVNTVEPNFCFHTVPYSSNLFHIYVKSMWTVPNPPGVILSHHKCLSNSKTEQVVILTLRGKDISQGLSLLHRVLTEGPEGDAQQAQFKLLGLKWLPMLTRLQAQELSPYEVGEKLYCCSQDDLMSSPALVCALRRVDAFTSLQRLLPDDYPGNLSVLMSPTPEVASRQASLLFFDHELVPDLQPTLEFPPQDCTTTDPQMLHTVCLFTPRIWNHALTEIFHQLQHSGLMLVGLRVVTLGRSDATSLLSAESLSDLQACVEDLCSGFSLVLCFQGENAVRKLLDMLGQQDSSIWTDCYVSGSCQKAAEDVKRFFPHGLCSTGTSSVTQEQILSMCSDPFASAEREQRCTMAPVVQQTLTLSNVSAPRGGSLIHSPTWQTTCLLIPLDAPLLSQVHSQLEMLEQLLRTGCHLVAGRMSVLDNKQRTHITETLKESSSGEKRLTQLYLNPYLIIALQGEQIVTNLKFILESIYKDRPDLEYVWEMIVYPGSEKEASSHCLIFLLASSSSLKSRARSVLLVVEVRLLKTGDGLGEKLPLTKSQMLLAPPFKPSKTSDGISLPREFWEEEVGVPRRPCSCLVNIFEGCACCDTAPDRRDCDRDWERELSGEVESDDEELKEEDRAKEPG